MPNIHDKTQYYIDLRNIDNNCWTFDKIIKDELTKDVSILRIEGAVISKSLIKSASSFFEKFKYIKTIIFENSIFDSKLNWAEFNTTNNVIMGVEDQEKFLKKGCFENLGGGCISVSEVINILVNRYNPNSDCDSDIEMGGCGSAELDINETYSGTL